MMDLTQYSEQIFDRIRHTDENGREYWLARELQKALEYINYRNFAITIGKAMEACKGSGQMVSDHFVEADEMVVIGSGAHRALASYTLSRYACYLIVMNGDSSKPVIAVGQTYFAVKTRQQELMDHYDELTENQKRIAVRNEMTAHNKSLAEAARQAGVVDSLDYAVFQNKGYQGLYGGLNMRDIHTRKKLKKSQKILDHMGSTELAANLFRATQTDEKLRREHITGKAAAGSTHFEVGKKVRQTIQELGGTMPEDLPTPAKSIRQIEREQERKTIED
ncbi:MAG: DNA damage-inducible protein D [Oscillospiraceae bacterium]|nr:DNA damage-inducible protein D [Oscillospiraceae bacterium]